MTKTNFKSIVNGTTKDIFDILHPIGECYTQYPGQSSPNDLWGDFSTWTKVNYAGSFFRAEGGTANSFSTTVNGGVQQGKVKGHTHGVTDTHKHIIPLGGILPQGAEVQQWELYNNTLAWGPTTAASSAAYSTSPSRYGSILVNSNDANATENLVTNQTYIIWKRTA